MSSAILLAIWPLPGTIALRHFLLLVGFLSAFQVIRSSKIDFRIVRCWPIWVFFGFFGWLIFHLVFLSSDYLEQLKELTGLWARAFMAAVMALGLGLCIASRDSIDSSPDNKSYKAWITNILIAGFGGTVTIFLCVTYMRSTTQKFGYILIFS